MTRCKHSICSLWHFLLCIFTTHPPPPSSLFYSTEINSLLPETGFRCCLQSTVLPSIKGGNYGLLLVTHSQCFRVKIYFLTQKSWKHRQSPLHSKAKIFFCSFGLNEALYGSTSMSQPYNMVNYGVSQLLTNVIKHKGITTTLAKCVTRCKHHFCSLCPFLICIDTHPPCLKPYNMVNYGVSQLLTNVIKHKGITTNWQSVWPDANTPFAVCGLCLPFFLKKFCSAFLPPTHPHPPPYFIVLKLTLFLQKLGSGVAYYPLSYIA